ncbi:methyl-accepting chemotaxis protein [Pararobbsia silviterrae]|uniref:HAMP domain-containing protein n=1 Tax=Pararobbsia silviterrae TaxID=1792498 RepID=A0A494X9B2_9BURK|nr:methyl-accepting chemotaxis protein [Pararobbsia silviterrae]RKP46231.1 HAMP domain-containing protein [Pararobbsia silviterrae]
MSALSSIRIKIIGVLSLCAIIALVIGLFGIYGLSRINDNVANVYSQIILPISDISETRAATSKLRLELRRLQLKPNAEVVTQLTPEIQGDLADIDKSWHAYYPASVLSAEERRVADADDAGLTQLAKETRDQLALFASGDFDKATQAVEQTAATSNQLISGLRDDEIINVKEAKDVVDDSESIFQTLRWVAIGLVAFGAAILAGAAIYLMRAITRPLDEAVTVANEIADGHLDNTIAIASRDEFGMLLGALQKMDQRLSETVRGIKRSTDSVSHASKEIASGNLDLSSRTEEQAASLEETASSMTELTETVRQNAENARQANSMADEAKTKAATGNEAVRTMVETIGKISDSSTKISEITGLIEGIAFQTNILALNAAVEAARAGEQGRGFAVVASEVRSLAQRSAAAAKEIKELIGTSVSMIQDGSQQAVEVGTTMDEVKRSIQRVADIVAEITAASDEQSRGIEQVNQAINQMDDVTQQNAALVEQAAAAAQSLDEQANNLKTAVAVFRVNDHADATRASASRMAGGDAPRPSAPRAAVAPSARSPKVERPREPAPARAAQRPAPAVSKERKPAPAPAPALASDGDASWETF